MTYEEAVAWLSRYKNAGLDLSEAIAVLEREHEEAERYRYLRTHRILDGPTHGDWEVRHRSGSRWLYPGEESLDAAIDAARKGEK